MNQQLSDQNVPGIGVIHWEEEDANLSESSEQSEFGKLLNESNGTEIKEGSIVKGHIIRISDDYVSVDIGHKMEGEVPIGEFKKADGNLVVSEGDEVEVFLDRFEDNQGDIVLSRERAQMLKAWDRISDAYEKGEIIEGTIMARVKGGLSVDIDVKAFLPGSQVDLRPVRNLDKLIGNKFQFKIIKFNKKRGNIVLSRRVLLEQDREKLRSETMRNLEEGATLKGIVKNITDYGAFIDLGGIDGLLHITDMSWGRITHPSQMFEIGQEIEVKVLSYDEGRQRVSLGYKQLMDDPWSLVIEKYPIGTKCSGVVVSLTDYGAFVEIEDGIEGLIHVSEMSWSRRVKHPSKYVSVGDEIDVVVLAINEDNRRISLGMKQTEPNPWEVVQEKYNVGDVIRGTIRNITDFGVFIGIEDGIDGLVHISDISWTERVKHPGDKFKKGDVIEAKILQIDADEEKFSLGIKQLEDDPWEKAAAEFSPGTKGKGTVTKVMDFGVFVEISPGIEGMIHVSEIDADENAKPADVVKEGEEVEFVVIASDTNARKFSLSRKAYLQKLEGEALKEYIGAAEPKTSIAEAFSRARGYEDEEDSSSETPRQEASEDKDSDADEGLETVEPAKVVQKAEGKPEANAAESEVQENSAAAAEENSDSGSSDKA